MNNLKRLVVILSLIFVLAATVFAGETPTPPCPAPEPGELSTPPCSSAQLTTDDPISSGETEAPPASETIVISTIAEAALGALLSVF
jgi:hypothetical protein